MKTNIDLNCDLGEWKSKDGHELDKIIMPYISSCNIACGGHIGDDFSMKKTIELALEHNVEIGAHPSFPDKESFGRKVVKMESAQLQEILINQISRLLVFLNEMGAKLHHIKPHGALYNEASKNSVLANTIIDAVEKVENNPLIYGAFNSQLEKTAKQRNVRFCAEGFADRVYESDLSLRSREYSDAVLHSEGEVLKQVITMVKNQKVITHSKEEIFIKVATICLHSDTPGAQALAKKIYQFLSKNDVNIVSV